MHAMLCMKIDVGEPTIITRPIHTGTWPSVSLSRPGPHTAARGSPLAPEKARLDQLTNHPLDPSQIVGARSGEIRPRAHSEGLLTC